MSRIGPSEVWFHPNSFGDPAGRLFRWNGQLYRGIRSEWMPVLERLMRHGVIRRLVDRGLLIQTEQTSLAVDGFEMVLRHPDIPFPSYAHEWCPEMLKDAALTIIDVLGELERDGLSLKDPHPWNVLFDGPKPVYVDVGSIIPKEKHNNWAGYDGFCRYTLYPLILMSQGQERIARWLFWEYEGVRGADLLMLTSQGVGSNLTSSLRKQCLGEAQQGVSSLYGRLGRRVMGMLRGIFPIKASPEERRVFSFETVRRVIEGITFPCVKSDSPGPDNNSTTPPSWEQAWSVKQQNVQRILRDLRPASVLDVGSTTNWYSKHAASLGSKVVALSIDSTLCTGLYRDARHNTMSILPLVMDFTRPTPARGLANECFIPASDRFRCDMVLALDVMSHIRRLNFEQIVEGLDLFSNRRAIVEFVPPDDPEVKELRCSGTGWYPLDIVLKTLGKRFQDIKTYPSDSTGRVLLLCEKYG